MFFPPQMCFEFVFQTSSQHFLLPGSANMELERYFGKAQKAHNNHTLISYVIQANKFYQVILAWGLILDVIEAVF